MVEAVQVPLTTRETVEPAVEEVFPSSEKTVPEIVIPAPEIEKSVSPPFEVLHSQNSTRFNFTFCDQKCFFDNSKSQKNVFSC